MKSEGGFLGRMGANMVRRFDDGRARRRGLRFSLGGHGRARGVRKEGGVGSRRWTTGEEARRRRAGLGGWCPSGEQTETTVQKSWARLLSKGDVVIDGATRTSRNDAEGPRAGAKGT